MLIRVLPIAAAAIAAIAIGSASPANAQPHSAIADIDLPEGTVPCTSSGCRTPPEHEEVWRYNAPSRDVVTSIDRQVNGARGATWWNDLQPCYDNHPSNAAHEWNFSDSARWLAVAVFNPGDIGPFGKIYIACGPVHPADPKGQCHHAYSHG
jgi:hypothetical protein